MAPQLRRTFIVGVGMTAFERPRGRVDYPELCAEAATKALLDAGVNYDEVESAFAGYVYGDSACGQRGLYALGMTSIPIVNVNNNCSTGSSALYLARQNVATGVNECSMAVGFEKMNPGSLASNFKDRVDPLSKTLDLTKEVVGVTPGPFAAQIFANGAEEYCQRYGATWTDVAAIAAKNHQHSVTNPYSQFRNSMTTEQVLADKKVTDKLTRGMACPTSDGGACAIIASEDFVRSHGLENQAIEIVGQGMATDSPHLFDDRSPIELTGADMTRIAAKQAYTQAGVGPSDISVIELHDCFAANELLVYDALGLSAPGKAHELVRAGDNTFGGKFLINPSGGLESKGHPLGATGLGMTFYLCHQLRGWAGEMQDPRVVPGAGGREAYAMAHNLGLGGSCVVTILKRPSFFKAGGADGRSRLGYNHAVECRGITQKDTDAVKSRKAFSEYARI